MTSLLGDLLRDCAVFYGPHVLKQLQGANRLHNGLSALTITECIVQAWQLQTWHKQLSTAAPAVCIGASQHRKQQQLEGAPSHHDLHGAGMAAADLAQAAEYCYTCSLHRGNLQAVWKLMGDVHLQFHAATPPATVGPSAVAAAAAAAVGIVGVAAGVAASAAAAVGAAGAAAAAAAAASASLAAGQQRMTLA